MPAQFVETEDGGEYVNLNHVRKATRTQKGVALFDDGGAELGTISVDAFEKYRAAAAKRLAEGRS